METPEMVVPTESGRLAIAVGQRAEKRAGLFLWFGEGQRLAFALPLWELLVMVRRIEKMCAGEREEAVCHHSLPGSGPCRGTGTVLKVGKYGWDFFLAVGRDNEELRVVMTPDQFQALPDMLRQTMFGYYAATKTRQELQRALEADNYGRIKALTFDERDQAAIDRVFRGKERRSTYVAKPESVYLAELFDMRRAIGNDTAFMSRVAEMLSDRDRAIVFAQSGGRG